MTLLIDWEIEQGMEDGAIRIEPFRTEQLNNASYDLTLGRFFYRLKEDPGGLALNGSMFQDEVIDANDAGGIVLAAGERVLGHSVEFVGGTVGRGGYAVNSALQATSTAARLGVTCCIDAGWGDVGFVNRWALEVKNLNPFPVFVPVGAIVCQVIFQTTAIPRRVYGQDMGQYQSSAEWPTEEGWDPKQLKPGRIKIGPAQAQPLPGGVGYAVENPPQEFPLFWRQLKSHRLVEILAFDDESREYKFKYQDNGRVAYRAEEVFEKEFQPQ